MKRSPSILLGDILEGAALLARYTSGLTFDEFAENTEKQDAVARRLEVIGEAVKGLPQSLRESHPDEPWREIAGARDVFDSRILPHRRRASVGDGEARRPRVGGAGRRDSFRLGGWVRSALRVTPDSRSRLGSFPTRVALRLLWPYRNERLGPSGHSARG